MFYLTASICDVSGANFVFNLFDLFNIGTILIMALKGIAVQSSYLVKKQSIPISENIFHNLSNVNFK